MTNDYYSKNNIPFNFKSKQIRNKTKGYRRHLTAKNEEN